MLHADVMRCLTPALCRRAASKALHIKWLDYVQKLKLLSGGKRELPLAELDLHGAEVEVLASTNPSLIGCRGVVVRLNEQVMHLVHDNGCTTGAEGEIPFFPFGSH